MASFLVVRGFVRNPCPPARCAGEEQRLHLERVLELKEREYGPDHLQIAVTLASLGVRASLVLYYSV